MDHLHNIPDDQLVISVDEDGYTNYYHPETRRLHRTNGPAVISPGGIIETWYYNGVVHRYDGPANIWYISGKRYEVWRRHGVLHRDDGPAKIHPHSQEWYVNGMYHRIDGPAVISDTGYMAWWMNDRRYTDNASYQKAAGLSDEQMIMMVLEYGDVH